MGFALKKEHLPHYTYSDYLIWEGKWELICGVPYAMSPSPTFYHQDINVNIVSYLKKEAGLCEGCVAIMSFDWKISEETVVQPDVSVTCGSYNDNYLETPPELVFEILSPSSVSLDKITKYELYQEEGVKYYIIVNPKTKSATINIVSNGKFDEVVEVATNDSFTFTLSKCTFDFDFSKIW